jgi:hypothetical protein
VRNADVTGQLLARARSGDPLFGKTGDKILMQLTGSRTTNAGLVHLTYERRLALR